ncbi:MAG: hypothetical protein QM582_15635 [Micropruina sp.]|uniref:hypothetical protein n=1 Tax=Micropruina sp. TaxID=2737536 RepID=UPI0039E48814
MGPRGGGGFGLLHMIAGLVGLALFFAILLGLAALAFQVARKKGWVGKGHRPCHGPHREPGAPPAQPGPWEALRILDERLARGDIEIADYQARRDALNGTSYPPFHQPPTHQPPTPPAPDAPTRVDHPVGGPDGPDGTGAPGA